MKIKYFLLLTIVIALTYSCKNDPEPAPAPTISSISPTKGTVNTEVTITGENFNASAASNTVKFNSVDAEVVSATPTQIIAKVPSNAGTGKVTVSTSSGIAEGPEFEYLEPPTITSVAPLTGPFGTSVTITGSKFEPVPSQNIVKFNGVEADVTSATSTQLVVTVPVGAGTGKIAVTTSVGTVEGPDFEFIFTAVVSTFAGDGTEGFADGTGLTAKFNFPTGLAFDANENLFVADRLNHRIRKITSDGVVTTFAGDGDAGTLDGNGTSAKLNGPNGLFFDSNGDLYVTDSQGGTIRKVTSTGDVTTVAGTGVQGYADGAALSAQFAFCTGIVMDSHGDLFAADFGNHTIRKISGGIVSTFAGTYDGDPASLGDYVDGTGAAARFAGPNYITIDANDNLYVSDFFNSKIRKITPAAVVTTVTGGDDGYLDGPAATAKFNLPYGLIFDKNGNLLICDGNNFRLRMLDKDGNVTTIAGSGVQGNLDGKDLEAQFSRLQGIAINSKGEIFVGDRNNFVIRKIIFQ